MEDNRVATESSPCEKKKVRRKGVVKLPLKVQRKMQPWLELCRRKKACESN